MPEVEAVDAAGSGREGAPSGSSARLRAWLPVVLWIGVIAFFSQDLFSAQTTGSLVEALLRRLGVRPEHFEIVHFFVRKSGHVTLYGVLGWLALRAAAVSWEGPLAVLAALALALAVAAGDEIHQSTTTSRTGSPRDVGLDLAAAGLGAAVRRWRSGSLGPSQEDS